MKSNFEKFYSKGPDDLKKDLLHWKKELFTLKMQCRLGKLEKTSSIKEARRNVAKIKTAMRAKLIESNNKSSGKVKAVAASSAKKNASSAAAKKPSAVGK